MFEVTGGVLYIVATPIGNLEDITLRALEAIKRVDVLYAEDTRVTRKLLDRYEVKKPLFSYRESASPQQVKKTLQEITSFLEEGKAVAYMSDAGTPGISDPGSYLVNTVQVSGYTVVPIPGVSALATILSVSGFIAKQPLFVGFLPKKKGHQTLMVKLQEALENNVCDTIVMYESPERIVRLMEELDAWPLPLVVCVGRELTKLHEEIVKGTTDEVLSELKKRKIIKGEITISIAKAL